MRNFLVIALASMIVFLGFSQSGVMAAEIELEENVVDEFAYSGFDYTLDQVKSYGDWIHFNYSYAGTYYDCYVVVLEGKGEFVYNKEQNRVYVYGPGEIQVFSRYSKTEGKYENAFMAGQSAKNDEEAPLYTLDLNVDDRWGMTNYFESASKPIDNFFTPTPPTVTPPTVEAPTLEGLEQVPMEMMKILKIVIPVGLVLLSVLLGISMIKRVISYFR